MRIAVHRRRIEPHLIRGCGRHEEGSAVRRGRTADRATAHGQSDGSHDVGAGRAFRRVVRLAGAGGPGADLFVGGSTLGPDGVWSVPRQTARSTHPEVPTLAVLLVLKKSEQKITVFSETKLLEYPISLSQID